MNRCDAVRSVWLVLTIFGYLFASFGIMRESFASLAQLRGFGEDRFGEGPFGGGLTTGENRLVRPGLKIRLLPADRELAIDDRKRNAALAVAGVFLVGLPILSDIALKASSAGAVAPAQTDPLPSKHSLHPFTRRLPGPQES